MKKQTQLYVLGALVVVLLYIFFFQGRQDGSGVAGVFAYDTKFVPLSVDEPQLRLDLLASLKKLEYTGSHRDIFSAVALPVAPVGGEKAAEKSRWTKQTVTPPPPLPPVQVPGTLYGFAAMKDSGKRVAFFQEGEDVLVVEEGAEFLHGYRLIKIGNDSADVEELSSGRHATVPMTQPANNNSNPNDAGANNQ
jgi:hypothetical protein